MPLSLEKSGAHLAIAFVHLPLWIFYNTSRLVCNTSQLVLFSNGLLIHRPGWGMYHPIQGHSCQWHHSWLFELTRRHSWCHCHSWPCIGRYIAPPGRCICLILNLAGRVKNCWASWHWNMMMNISVVIFGPLFENIHFSIFQQMRMLKILAAVKKKFNFLQPGPPWARFCDPGVPDHLETPQSGQMDSKMEVYVEIISCEHFRFYCEKIFVSNFLDFV